MEPVQQEASKILETKTDGPRATAVFASLSRHSALYIALAVAVTFGAPLGQATAAEKLKVAAVFETPIEEPWVNQIHVALLKAKDELGIEYVWSESVKSADFARVMRDYAEGGYGLIMGDSFGAERIARRVAKDYPDVAFGHDCIMDPWYSLGSHDMLEVASMGLHVGQMTGISEMRQAFDAVTANGAAVMGLEDCGLESGYNAHFVILQAADPIEALRLKPARLFVVRRGQIIAETPPVESRLTLDGETTAVDFSRPVL